jgi:GntR family transcriptional regulator/MocR family aminotransferase
MDLHLAVSTSGDIAASLYRQLLAAVRDGRLMSGERLPSTRELAQSLNLSRGTVASAYERLAAEGILETRHGSGTYIPAHVTPSRARCAPSGERVAPRSVWSELPPYVPDPVDIDVDLAGGEPDPSLFPLATWRRLVSETLRPSLMATSPYAGTSHPALQDAIAAYLGRSRSVVAQGDDIILTNGSQQAYSSRQATGSPWRALATPASCGSGSPTGPASRAYPSTTTGSWSTRCPTTHVSCT